jgi:hypothetical protein
VPFLNFFEVMELLGINVADLRRARPEGRFSLSTSAYLARQMLSALQPIHELGYVHRDVKPVWSRRRVILHRRDTHFNLIIFKKDKDNSQIEIWTSSSRGAV